MIKQLLTLLLGAIAASFIYFVLVYCLGLGIEALGISLYDSESGQQRNFNVVIILWCVIASVGGLPLGISKKPKPIN